MVKRLTRSSSKVSFLRKKITDVAVLLATFNFLKLADDHFICPVCEKPYIFNKLAR